CGGGTLLCGSEKDFMSFAFGELPGMLIEYDPDQITEIEKISSEYGDPFKTLCLTEKKKQNRLYVNYNLEPNNFPMKELRVLMERTGFEIAKRQADPVCAEEEFASYEKE